MGIIRVLQRIFPTLLLVVTGATTFDNINTNKFILNRGSSNLPYDMNGMLVASGSSLNDVLSESGVTMESGGVYILSGGI